MSQHYPPTHHVRVPDGTWYPPSRLLVQILKRDGQITPILVKGPDEIGDFEAADKWQGERVLAAIEAGFTTLLVETEWTEEDL